MLDAPELLRKAGQDPVPLSDIQAQTETDYRRHLSPKLLALIKFAGYGVVSVSAEGMYVTDNQGQRWLDCAGGYGVFALGHRHPTVVAAVHRQLDEMPLSAKVFLEPVEAELAAALADQLPGDLQYCFFCNSGTEAVEGALKLARLKTGRTQFISTLGAFHGKTLGALSVSGRSVYRQDFEPLIPDVLVIPYGNAELLREAVTDETAALILEPIQGEGGIVVPPDGYLTAAREITRQHGALLILDEVQTGLGRTGYWFACQHEDVTPDIIVLAKALGGGVMPIGCFAGTPAVWDAFRPKPLIHTSTFGGNPLACAAALATLRVIQTDGLVERARTMDTKLKTRLRDVAAAHPRVIADVRGRGLMIGVEMTSEGLAGAIMSEMAKRRVIAVHTLNQQRVIRFEPPLIIEDEHIDQAVSAFAEAVKITEKQFAPAPAE